jgi:acetylglutamate kinase
VTRPTVVKYGGHAMDDERAREAFARDVVLLRDRGRRPVVVHGGGPQITARLTALGIVTPFVHGRRVTTAEAMAVVRAVLVEEVNPAVVALLDAQAPYATGVSGEDLFAAVPRDPALGHVGEVTAVDTAVVERLLDAGRIPVVATVARGVDGALYNVNADTAAAALAVALGAAEAVFLTDVEGLYSDYPARGSLVRSITADALEALLPSLSDGMVPKMEACLRVVRGGVPRAHVLDGRVPHALLATTGTLVTA